MISDNIWSSINRSVVYLILVCFVIKLQTELTILKVRSLVVHLLQNVAGMVQSSQRQVRRRQPEPMGTSLNELLMNVLPSPDSFISLQASSQT